MQSGLTLFPLPPYNLYRPHPRNLGGPTLEVRREEPGDGCLSVFANA